MSGISYRRYKEGDALGKKYTTGIFEVTYPDTHTGGDRKFKRSSLPLEDTLDRQLFEFLTFFIFHLVKLLNSMKYEREKKKEVPSIGQRMTLEEILPFAEEKLAEEKPNLTRDNPLYKLELKRIILDVVKKYELTVDFGPDHGNNWDSIEKVEIKK